MAVLSERLVGHLHNVRTTANQKYEIKNKPRVGKIEHPAIPLEFSADNDGATSAVVAGIGRGSGSLGDGVETVDGPVRGPSTEGANVAAGEKILGRTRGRGRG